MDTDTELTGHFYFIIAVALVIILVLTSSGCQNVSYTEYDEWGNITKQYKRDGFIDFSDGDGKQLPFSHISVIGK